MKKKKKKKKAATWLQLCLGSSPRLLLRWGFAWGRGAFSLRSTLAAFDVHVLPWVAFKGYFIKRKQYNDPEQIQTELNGT